MEKKIKKQYIQDAHMRYIIDYFSDKNHNKIKNRKTYLIYQLGLGCLILLALLVIYPKAEFIYAFIGIGLYLFGLEIGRREGYIKAYKNLPEYDYGYIERWKKIRNIDHEKSNLTDDEAYNNQRKTLKGLDFPLSGDDSD